MVAMLLSPKGNSEVMAASSPIAALDDVGGPEKLKPLCPRFEVEVGAALCPLTAMSPCWPVEQSLMLHASYLWRHVS